MANGGGKKNCPLPCTRQLTSTFLIHSQPAHYLPRYLLPLFPSTNHCNTLLIHIPFPVHIKQKKSRPNKRAIDCHPFFPPISVPPPFLTEPSHPPPLTERGEVQRQCLEEARSQLLITSLQGFLKFNQVS